jgi:hypothetical protein
MPNIRKSLRAAALWFEHPNMQCIQSAQSTTAQVPQRMARLVLHSLIHLWALALHTSIRVQNVNGASVFSVNNYFFRFLEIFVITFHEVDIYINACVTKIISEHNWICKVAQYLTAHITCHMHAGRTCCRGCTTALATPLHWTRPSILLPLLRRHLRYQLYLFYDLFIARVI